MFSSLARSTAAAIGGFLFLLLGTGVASLWVSREQALALEQVQSASELIQSHMTADMMHDAIRADVLSLLRGVQKGDAAAIRAAQADLAAHERTFQEAISVDRRLGGTSSGISSEIAAADPLIKAYLADATAVARAATERPDEVERRFGPFLRSFSALEGTMEKVSDAISAHVSEVVRDANRIGTIAETVIIGGMLLSIVAAVLLGLACRRHVVAPLERLNRIIAAMTSGNLAVDTPASSRSDEIGSLTQAVRVFRDQLAEARGTAERVRDEQARLICTSIGSALGELARGNLTARVKADLEGPYAQLKTDMNAAMEQLSALIGSLARAASTIETGSTEIEHAASDLARRTESNAASIEETTAALVEVNSRIDNAAKASKDTAEKARAMLSTVAEGRDQAADAVAVMGKVNECAMGIDNVIEGLDKIAFQTRVLAMNAAVEAGRAGEAGRGFAVVADLVSALAMRAEEEAKQARDQLIVTQTEIKSAVGVVINVDKVLTRISADVSGVQSLIDTVVEESRSQAVALSEITSAVQAMDLATQANASMVEQASNAARLLTGEVRALSSDAGRFQVAA